jgi:lipoprotein NlpI
MTSFDHRSADNHYDSAMMAYASGNYGNSLQILSRVLEIDPQFEMAYYIRGASYYKMGQMERSVRDLTKAIELDPKDARFFHLRGVAKERMCDYAGALADINTALALDPTYAAALQSRARIHEKSGRPQLAQKDYASVTNLTDHNPDGSVFG